eukprot:TRINITY_DN14024_c0_g1_i1.p1 TRINITY_DN14024_c0_g1~~TRINITY_DN14024_c0_g1_i1.p1  ORF type:complete len:542 (+),score=73.65 TRINITY_DN14024_c0_g1_i1:588-2213(+)
MEGATVSRCPSGVGWVFWYQGTPETPPELVVAGVRGSLLTAAKDVFGEVYEIIGGAEENYDFSEEDGDHFLQSALLQSGVPVEDSLAMRGHMVTSRLYAYGCGHNKKNRLRCSMLAAAIAHLAMQNSGYASLFNSHAGLWELVECARNSRAKPVTKAGGTAVGRLEGPPPQSASAAGPGEPAAGRRWPSSGATSAATNGPPASATDGPPPPVPMQPGPSQPEPRQPMAGSVPPPPPMPPSGQNQRYAPDMPERPSPMPTNYRPGPAHSGIIPPSSPYDVPMHPLLDPTAPRECMTDPSVDLRSWGGGPMLWPYCKICDKWWDSSHVASTKHINRLGHYGLSRRSDGFWMKHGHPAGGATVNEGNQAALMDAPTRYTQPTVPLDDAFMPPQMPMQHAMQSMQHPPDAWAYGATMPPSPAQSVGSHQPTMMHGWSNQGVPSQLFAAPSAGYAASASSMPGPPPKAKAPPSEAGSGWSLAAVGQRGEGESQQRQQEEGHVHDRFRITPGTELPDEFFEKMWAWGAANALDNPTQAADLEAEEEC